MKLISSWLIAVTIATIGNNEIGAYKILGVFPTLARSHYIVGSALMRGLAEAGHEVTMISPFAEKNPPTNYTEVHLEGLVTKMLQGKRKIVSCDAAPGKTVTGNNFVEPIDIYILVLRMAMSVDVLRIWFMNS